MRRRPPDLVALHQPQLGPGRGPARRTGSLGTSASTSPATPPLRHGSYRGLAATANNFARESFMDELAELAGLDPLAFRLAHLDNPRIRAVLEDGRPPGRLG